jgi:hypothetical protein
MPPSAAITTPGKVPRALTARTTIGQHLTSTTKNLSDIRPTGHTDRVAAPITQICAADLKNDDTGKANHNGGLVRSGCSRSVQADRRRSWAFRPLCGSPFPCMQT